MGENKEIVINTELLRTYIEELNKKQSEMINAVSGEKDISNINVKININKLFAKQNEIYMKNWR